jgi:hypothetical protein
MAGKLEFWFIRRSFGRFAERFRCCRTERLAGNRPWFE